MRKVRARQRETARPPCTFLRTSSRITKRGYVMSLFVIQYAHSNLIGLHFGVRGDKNSTNICNLSHNQSAKTAAAFLLCVCVWSSVGNDSVPVRPVMRLVHPIRAPLLPNAPVPTYPRLFNTVFHGASVPEAESICTARCFGSALKLVAMALPYRILRDGASP